MATRTLTSRSISGPPLLMVLAAAGLAVILALATVIVTLVSQPPAANDPVAASYSSLAGMGGLPNPARHKAATGWAEIKVPLANLAGMGGLPNPARRD